MTKILITGASGFIGKNLISYLNQKNYKLKILYRNNNYANYLKKFGEIYFCDLKNLNSLNGFLKDVEVIIHSAGSVRGNSYKDFYEGNVSTTENLIKLIKKEAPNLKKFIYLSSLSASGPSNGENPPTEEEIPTPVSYYGISKLQAEELIKSNLNIPFFILRLTGVYGPEDKEIFKFFKYANKGTLFLPFKKNQKIQLIYVKDVCLAIEKAIENENCGTFFIAHSEILQILEIFFFLKEIIGRSIKIITLPDTIVKLFSYLNWFFGFISGRKTMFNPQKVKELLSEKWICSTEKAEKILKFKAEYSFNRGAKETYKWYIDNKWL